MASKRKISGPIREIIRVLLQNPFKGLTLRQIAEKLHLDPQKGPNTVNQRILRDKEGYFITSGKKPKKISLNPDNDEIFYLGYNNRCQICGKTLSRGMLNIRTEPRAIKGIPKEWLRRLIYCVDCKDISWDESKLNTTKSKPQVIETIIEEDEGDIWKYKLIRIKSRHRLKKGEEEKQERFGIKLYKIYRQEDYEVIFEFNELRGEGWFFLTDKGSNKVTSRKVVDILDYFGEQGWELVFMKDLSQPRAAGIIYPTLQQQLLGMMDDQLISRPFGSHFSPRDVIEQYECVFKKKVKDGE
ncbi:MAG: hypothetical protein ACFFCS_21825 [Candidatus Hodarchaeota archaeon]